MEQHDSVRQLNTFLRGELSAAETYRKAIEKLDGFSQRGVLENCWRSHLRRADVLAREVRRLGGEPAESSGPWGALARVIESGAALIGEKAAISALENGEDHRRDEYQRELDMLPREVRAVLESTVIPEQAITHAAISALKKSMS